MNNFEYARTKFREYIEEKGSAVVAEELKQLMREKNLKGPTFSEYLKATNLLSEEVPYTYGQQFSYGLSDVPLRQLNVERNNNYHALFSTKDWQEEFDISANDEVYFMELQA